MKKLNLISKIGLATLALLGFGINLNSQTCDVNFQYRTPIVIKNTGVALTNHAVKITINTATLVSAGKMQASGNDIRFTDTLCNQLNYWIESGMNTASTVIWVKIPSLTAAANRTINMYYSYPSAGAASNGSGVFDFFDDFNGSSLSGSWNYIPSGTSSLSVSSGAVNISTNTAAVIITTSAYSTPNHMEIKVNSFSGNWPNVAQLNPSTFDGVTATVGGSTQFWGPASAFSNSYQTNLYSFAGTPANGIWGINWIGTNNYRATFPASFANGTTSASMPGTSRMGLGSLQSGTGSISVDWARVRKYAAVEPTLTVGAEVVNYVLRVNNMSTGINATNYSTWCNNVTMYMIPEVGGRFNNPCFVRLQMSDASGSFSNPKVIQRFNFSNQNLFLSLWNIIGVFDSGSLASPNVPYGTGYKFRLVSSSINYTGPPSANSYTFGATPVPNFTINNAAQCNEIDKFTFTNSGTIGAGNSAVYNWDFGDTSTGTGSPVSHGYAYHGTKNVKLVSVNSQVPQCADSIVKQVTVYAQPVADFYQYNQCQQYFNDFYDQSYSATGFVNGWNWNFGDATTSTQQNPSKKYTSPGSYQVRLIATTNQGCKDTVTKTHIALHSPSVSWTNGLACDGNKVEFTNFTTQNTLGGMKLNRYEWYFGDGGISLERNPGYLYSSTGTYYVNLFVYNTNGCYDTFSKWITVNPKPKAGFTAGNVCLNSGVPIKNLSAISSGTLSYGWNFGNGTTMGNVQTPSLSYNQAGTYTIKLIATSGLGCKDSASKDVTIYNKAVAGFTVDEVCEGTASSFINTSTNASTFNWNFDGQGTDNAQNPLFTFTGASNHPVTLISTSVNGCKDTVMHDAVVNPNPTVSFSKSANGLCLNGNSFNFTNNSSIGSGSMTHNWTFGNGASSTDLSPSVSYLNPGTYTIKLGTSSNKGCSGSASTTVTVYPQTKTDFNAADVCRTTATSFTNKSAISSGTFSNSWNFGDGNTSAFVSPSNTYSNAGSYSVKLTTTSNNGCVDSMRKLITVHPLPVVAFTGTSVCLGSASSFNNTTSISNGFITNNNWAFGDGGLSTDLNPTHTYASAGTFNVSLNVKSDKGCIGSATNSIEVYPMPKASFTAANGCLGTTTSFTNTSTGTLAVTSWDFGDGKSSTATSPNNVYASAGVYNVSLNIETDKGCKSSVSKNVEIYVKPNADFTASTLKTPITKPEISFQDVSLYGDFSDWNFGNGATSNMPIETIKYASVGKFNVKLISKTDKGCSDTTSKEVEITNDFRVFFPNSFTPDGNNLNEGFGAIGILNGITTFSMVITSKNGGVMYSTTDITKKWNGKIDNTGELAPDGNYAYFVKFKDYNGKEYNKNGIVTLVK